MAEEVKDTGKGEIRAETKPPKSPESLAPPFTIRRRIVLDGNDYLPGDEEKLRPKLNAANFAALCEQEAIARLEPKTERPKA